MMAVSSLFSAAAGVFILLVIVRAAMHKAVDFGQFQGFVADYRLLPEPAVAPVAWAALVGECLLALLIVWPSGRSLGLALAACLFAAYGAVIAINLRRGHRHIECGCGGAPQVLSESLIGRNAALIVIAFWAASTAPRSLDVAATLAVIGAGVLLLAFYCLFEQLNANRMYLKNRSIL